MNPIEIINIYYPEENDLRITLLTHSCQVAKHALAIIKRHPELPVDEDLVYEGAMLHDIGILYTDAPKIFCTGKHPYICHGYLGAEMLRKEGYPIHAGFCERHTGTGLSIARIQGANLPIPRRDMRPQTLEEEIVCYADKFYSKSRLKRVKTVEDVLHSLSKYGPEEIERFNEWHKRFG